MGGYGSGWQYWQGKKNTVEDCRQLSISRWVREGIVDTEQYRKGSWVWSNRLTGKRHASITYEVDTLNTAAPSVRLSYTITRLNSRKRDVSYRIPLQRTPCNFGGFRWWFTCPLVRSGKSCGRRCGKLYLPPGGTHFGCRTCHDLTYTSCQESHKYDSLWQSIGGMMNLPQEQVKRLLG